MDDATSLTHDEATESREIDFEPRDMLVEELDELARGGARRGGAGDRGEGGDCGACSVLDALEGRPAAFFWGGGKKKKKKKGDDV